MEPIQVGILSILPPIIAIVLALITKEVISSILIGIFSGACIYSFNSGGEIIKAIEVTFTLMSKKIGENAFIIIFLALLGSLVVVITKAGGSQAYGNWVSKRINSRLWAQLSTAILGILIFIDDYFNCLTVGTVMKPVTDKQKVSRVKLAYLIDATAAPICIIAPVSSWAASVISYMDGSGLNGMNTFLKTIPYNLYAILTIIMIIIISLKNLDFGKMAKFEKQAIENGDVDIAKHISSDINSEDECIIPLSENGRVIDLIIPIASLIIFSFFFMIYIGGYFSENISLSEAFINTDSAMAITYGAFISIVISFFMFVPRRLLSFKDFMSGINQGIKTMVPAFIILTLAWTISGICRDLLNTGQYVGDLFKASNIPIVFLPCIVFIISGFLAFAMGTSWGSFGILIPIVVMVCEKAAPELMIITLSATLAGSVFGDHCSPISDTTILSSAGTGCDHMDHVSTQIPYACLVAFVSFVGYLIAGISHNILITLSISIILLIIFVFVLHKNSNKKSKVQSNIF